MAQPGMSDHSGALKEGNGKAIVKSIDPAAKTILIDHNTIPGVMDGMAMAYPVDRDELLSVVKPGDSVNFTLKEKSAGEFVISAISVIPKR